MTTIHDAVVDSPLLPVGWTLKDCRVPHRLYKKRQRIHDIAVEVILEFEDYWPLTVRFVHYKIVSIGDTSLYENTQKDYERLCDILAYARLRSRAVPWAAITDESRKWTEWRVFSGPRDFIKRESSKMFRDFNRDLLIGQPVRPFLFVEKLALHDIVCRAASPYCADVACMKGQSSWTMKDQIRRRTMNHERCHLLFLGDADPTGLVIPARIKQDLIEELGCDHLTFERIALWPEQAQELNLPPSFVKETDANTPAYREHFGGECWELDALDPPKLEALTADRIERILDMPEFRRQQEIEQSDIRKIDRYRERVLATLPPMPRSW